ncbi:hypothetical protein HII31_01678 [Pseudocercospora fuligena]|uniref:Uncharacterized protein n=1 Tax=Pseudocercospora fuligena TaxID=685502 RepID=A0A8H6VLN6_9PEZI|nr:hypothetical protein HII31_01678 [Pseudocercospora fuligena]
MLEVLNGLKVWRRLERSVWQGAAIVLVANRWIKVERKIQERPCFSGESRSKSTKLFEIDPDSFSPSQYYIRTAKQLATPSMSNRSRAWSKIDAPGPSLLPAASTVCRLSYGECSGLEAYIPFDGHRGRSGFDGQISIRALRFSQPRLLSAGCLMASAADFRLTSSFNVVKAQLLTMSQFNFIFIFFNASGFEGLPVTSMAVESEMQPKSNAPGVGSPPLPVASLLLALSTVYRLSYGKSRLGLWLTYLEVYC